MKTFGKDNSDNASTNQYRALASLASDYLWELDEQLQFIFHDGINLSLSGYSNEELVGQCRLAVMSAAFPQSAELTQHNQCLLRHERVDVVLPTGLEPIKHIHIIAEPQFDDDGVFTGFIGCARDMTNRVEMEKQLAKLATMDDLTGVMNRREFAKQLNALHQEAQVSADQFTLCVLDLDRFKQVNDAGGHQAGDQLLRELVTIMSRYLQPGEAIGRLGGDEFGLLLRSSINIAKTVMEQLISEVSRYQFKWEDRQFNVGASIGLAAIEQGSGQPEELLITADMACYDAKNNGRNHAVVSHGSFACEHLYKQTTKPVEEALRNNQFKLLVQPIAALGNRELLKRYELLLRLECADGSLLEPDAFMPIAKRFSLMQELDHWVVENALAALQCMQENGEDVAININLSAHTLVNQAALNRIKALFGQHAIAQKCVCIEIAETHAMRNFSELTKFMWTVQQLGVEFALDDFGNDMSSVNYLRKLPIDYLKIDGELIRSVATDRTVYSVVAAFNDLAHTLGIRTVAESVEDDATIEAVANIGVDYVQGFGVSKLQSLTELVPHPQEQTAPLRLEF